VTVHVCVDFLYWLHIFQLFIYFDLFLDYISNVLTPKMFLKTYF